MADGRDKDKSKRRGGVRSLREVPMPAPPPGKPSDYEQGIEEGDLIMDYLMPIRSLAAKPATAVMNAVKNAATPGVRRKLLEQLRLERERKRLASMDKNKGVTKNPDGTTTWDYSEINKIQKKPEGPTVDYNRTGKDPVVYGLEGDVHRFPERSKEPMWKQKLRESRDKK